MANGNNPLQPLGINPPPAPTVPGGLVNDPRLVIPATGLVPGVSQQQSISLQDLRQYMPQQSTQPQQPPRVQQAISNPDQSQVANVSGKQPASIRYNNPGAMWPSSSSVRFGSSTHGVLSDGNHIAYFDDPVAGAAAQFDELSQPRYINKPIGDLIDIWSGHTGGKANVSAYATNVANALGLSPTDRLTPELLRSPAGIAFAKAQARMEAGSEYPLSDAQWQQAQNLAFGAPAQPQTQVAQANPIQPGMTVGDLMQYTRQ